MSDRVVTPELLWQIPRVGDPVAAADGSRVVTTVTTYDIEANEGLTRIYDITSDDAVPLTADTASATQPALSADGSLLAFVRKVDGVAQVHVMPTTGGEPRPVTETPLGVNGPRWLPDGSGLLFLATVYRDALTLEAAAERKEALEESKVTAHVTEDRMYRFWDRWLDRGEIPHLFHLDLGSGAVVDLTPDETAWWTWDNVGTPGANFDISPDGSTVAFSAIPYRPDDPPVSAVFTVPIAGGPVTEISGGHPANCTRPRFSPTGDLIVYGRQERNDFYADRVRLVAHVVATGSASVLTEEWDASASGWEFHGAERLVFVAEENAGAAVFTMPIYDPQPVKLAEGGTAAGVCVAGDRLLVKRDSISSPAEIHRVEDGSFVPHTDFTREALDGVELARVENTTFEGADGASIQMFVLHPPGFDETRQWPLVHLIHGGPHGVFGDQWHHRWNAQAVAAAGHVVAHVNFHGSTSWGQAFAESIQGAWGDRPARDVMAATDVLVARGYVDPARMAITGGSYGGYLTAWLTTQTDRFACAIAHAAVTNLGGMHASDVVFHRATAYGAEYWVDHERVDLWSPSTHAAGYSTPTLVIHGELDYRVPVTQGLELYGVLKAKGVEARLVVYPDENHWILSPQNSLHWYGEFLGWLDRHLDPGR